MGELYKVNSDEATRCAVRLNRVNADQCDWLCAFNKIPQYHRKGCWNNFERCLRQTPAGSRMPRSMQIRVFENWYDTDLAKDAQAVYTNFLMVCGIAVLFVLICCRVCY